MPNKSIISLISFFLLSMFYVASASGSGVYANIIVEMPKKCGAWSVVDGMDQCRIKGSNKSYKHGKPGDDARFTCWGGRQNKARVRIDTSYCGPITFTHSKVKYQRRALRHTVEVIKGDARCIANGSCRDTAATNNFKINVR
jgi:hypothetical protein